MNDHYRDQDHATEIIDVRAQTHDDDPGTVHDHWRVKCAYCGIVGPKLDHRDDAQDIANTHTQNRGFSA